MELINISIGILLHLDQYLGLIIRNYGIWTYAIFFLIIFLETGLVGGIEIRITQVSFIT